MIKSFYFGLPFLFARVFYVWFSPFAMIINLLVWADVGTPSGHQGDGNSAV